MSVLPSTLHRRLDTFPNNRFLDFIIAHAQGDEEMYVLGCTFLGFLDSGAS